MNKKLYDKNNVGFNSDVLFEEVVEARDIRRVIRKMLTMVSFESMPAIAKLVPLGNVTPSTLDFIKCNAILNTYAKEHEGESHPRYNIDIYRENGDIIMDDYGVRKIPKDVAVEEIAAFLEKSTEVTDIGTPVHENVVQNNMGILSNEIPDIQYACASTLCSFYSLETQKGDIMGIGVDTEKVEALGMPSADISTARRMVLTGEMNASSAQNLMFYKCKINPLGGFAFVDRLYAQFPQYSVQAPENNEAVEAYKFKEAKERGIKYVPDKTFVARIPGVFRPDFDLVDDEIRLNLPSVWALHLISQSIRGGDKKGIGSVTSGYYNFEMPPHYVKAIARAREMIKMRDITGVKCLRISSSKEYSSLLIDILISNGVVVVSDGGTHSYEPKMPPGHYHATNEVIIRIMKNPLTSPTYSKKAGPIIEYKDFEKRFSVFDSYDFSGDYKATLTYLVPQVVEYAKKHNYTLFPSLSPHSLKVWLFTFDLNAICPVPKEMDLIRRSFDAIYARNLFCWTRRPYCSDDPMRSYFAKVIVIPKVQRKVTQHLFSITPSVYKLDESLTNCRVLPSIMKTIIQADAIIDEVEKQKFTLLSRFKNKEREFLASFYTDVFLKKEAQVNYYRSMKYDMDKYGDLIRACDLFVLEEEARRRERSLAKERYDNNFKNKDDDEEESRYDPFDNDDPPASVSEKTPEPEPEADAQILARLTGAFKKKPAFAQSDSQVKK